MWRALDRYTFPHFPQAPPRTRPRLALPREQPLLPRLGGAGAGSGWLRAAATVAAGSGSRPKPGRSQFAGGPPAGSEPPREVTPLEGATPAPYLRVPAGLGGGQGVMGRTWGNKGGRRGPPLTSPPPSWAHPGALIGRGRGREPSWEQEMGPYGDGRKLLSSPAPGWGAPNPAKLAESQDAY